MYSVYVKEVGLHSRLQAELQFVDCVISARFSLGRKIQCRRRQLQLPNHPHLPTCKAKVDGPGKWQRNQDSLHVLYASQAAL